MARPTRPTRPTRRAVGPRRTRGSNGVAHAPIERYAFVALTATDLAQARRFWVEALGFSVTEEKAGDYFIVDAGGLRLCVDTADGEIHFAGGTDPVIGFSVRSLPKALAALAERGLRAEKGPVSGRRGAYAVLRDPDGRAVIVTEAD